jgi:hypothetical protein
MEPLIKAKLRKNFVTNTKLFIFRMEAIEIQVLKLTQTLCRLHRHERDAFNAVEQLNDERFENVSIEFVGVIYKQLTKETHKRTKIYRKNAQNKLYYTFVEKSYKSVALLSERYFLLYERKSIDPNVHKLELFDLFNYKSV